MRHALPPALPPALPLILLLACGDKAADTAGGAAADSGTPDTADACGPADDPDVGSPFEVEGVATCGEPIFQLHCAGCHGPAGLGTEAGPALAGHVVAHTDEELLFVLIVGQGDMPPQDLGNRENAHVLAWLRETFGAYNGQGH